MQRFFGVFVVIAILIGGGYYLYSQSAEQAAREKIEERLSSARLTFAKEARSAAAKSDPSDYLSAVKRALIAYEEALRTVVYRERPSAFDVDAMKREMDRQLEEGNISEAQHRGMKERFELVKAAYETLMAQSWTPVLTLPGKADTRLDIYDVRRIRGPDGTPLLEASFFFWGVEPNTQTSFGRLELEYWVEVEPDGRIKRRRRRDGRDPNAPAFQRLGRAEGDATPIVLDKDPARTIAQFPSYVSIGTLWFPQVPKEPKVMDIRYEYRTRKGGTESQTTLVWDKLPVPPKWRLGEGEAWMAEEVEVSAEELAGVDPDAPDAGTEEE